MATRKRINIYVENDVYQEFKQVCALTGETMTAVLDEAMKQYIESVKMIIEAGEKDKLMAMLQRRLNIQMHNIELEIDRCIEEKKSKKNK
jgi:antitoxin component of RelBE/YafQ-DinJ toxin-antitoxin module